MKATKLNPGHYEYKGWEIEKMEDGHWNMRPMGDDFWTDGAGTLSEAKEMADRWGMPNE